MSQVLTKIALAGSGVILAFIGSALMFAPQAFLKLSHVTVERDPGLMSELTAPSGVLLITGALMMLGCVKQRFTNPGLIAGAMVYGSYGFGRVVSMALHGVPSESLVGAMAVELGIAACLSILFAKRASVEGHNMIGRLGKEVAL